MRENKGRIAGPELRMGNGYPNFSKNHLTGVLLIEDNAGFGLSGRMWQRYSREHLSRMCPKTR